MVELHSKNTDRLFQVILALENMDQCYELFEDLCTVKELKEISQRLEVARLLSKGLSYQKVSEMTNASSATISRVKRCLDYGTGGYGKALKIIGTENET